MPGFDDIKNWMKENPYQSAGIIAGFVFSLLIVTIGVWKTLFIFVVTVGGYMLGKHKDETGKNLPVIDKIKEWLGIGKG